jgi:hypothetical protein
MLHAIVNCAMVLKIRLKFLLFSLGGAKTTAHLSIAEGSSFLSFDWRIYDCKLRNGRNIRNEYSPQLSKLLYNWQVKNKEAL